MTRRGDHFGWQTYLVVESLVIVNAMKLTNDPVINTLEGRLSLAKIPRKNPGIAVIEHQTNVHLSYMCLLQTEIDPDTAAIKAITSKARKAILFETQNVIAIDMVTSQKLNRPVIARFNRTPMVVSRESMYGLTEEANRPNRGPGEAVLGLNGHGWVRVELRVRRR